MEGRRSSTVSRCALSYTFNERSLDVVKYQRMARYLR